MRNLSRNDLESPIRKVVGFLPAGTQCIPNNSANHRSLTHLKPTGAGPGGAANPRRGVGAAGGPRTHRPPPQHGPAQGMSQEGGRQAEIHRHTETERHKQTETSRQRNSKSAGESESADQGGSARSLMFPAGHKQDFTGATVTSARQPPPPAHFTTSRAAPPPKARCTSPARPDALTWAPPAPGKGICLQFWPAPTSHG